jgi:hypothetical protein
MNWSLENYGKYLDYKRNKEKYFVPFQIENFKIDQDKIYYGVNLDMDHMEIPREEIRKKINPFINFCGFDDSLSYLRQTIKGMNLPQFYLKEKSVWTGGHEENCRIRSININHGPHASEWYGVRLEDAKIFSDYLKKKHNFDIYVKEGLWYEEWEYFLKNKINVLYTIQKEGDIILVGPGCIHWVKALGFAVHSSWNFFPKEKAAFETALDRFNINKKIPMRSLVPIYNLMIDILNFEMYYLDLNLVKLFYDKIRDIHLETINKFKKILNNQKYSNLKLQKEDKDIHLVVCELCYDELFNFWSFADLTKGKESYDAIMCSKCFEKEFNNFNKNSQISIGYKYDIEEIEKLLKRVERRIRIEEIGDIKYLNEFQPSLIKINNDTIFNCKIKTEFIKRNIDNQNMTFFLNKKNKIFEHISYKVILEDIKNNFEYVIRNNSQDCGFFNNNKINKIGNQKLRNLLLGEIDKEKLNTIDYSNSNNINNENVNESSQIKNFIDYLDKTKFQLVEEYNNVISNSSCNSNSKSNTNSNSNSNFNSLINENYIPLSKKDNGIILNLFI